MNVVFWRVITDLGDTAVMAPAGSAIAIWLFWRRAWGDGLRWVGLFGGGAIVVAATKIAFLGWGIGVPSLDFTGISGHAMTATAVLTVACYFLGSGFSESGATLGFAVGVGLGVMVAISRVMLGAHSASEAVAGCALGVVVAISLIGAPKARPLAALAPLALTIAMFAFVASGNVARAPTQDWITRAALELSGRATPFTR